MCMKLQCAAVSKLMFQDASLSYVPVRKIYKRLVCKRLAKRKSRHPWHIVKHDFYFTAKPSFSSYPSLITVHEFQRGLWDNICCKRGTYMITTSASTASLQVYLNSYDFGDTQVCHSSLQKAPFHVKSRASGCYASISQIRQTTTTVLWPMLSHFFSLSIPV